MKKTLIALALLATAVLVRAQAPTMTYRQVDNLSYVTSDDAYRQERCKLDVYYPDSLTGCPVVVWFHGGGLTSGEKFIPQPLKDAGYVVIAPNYRLMPNVTIDACIDDAAAAVAWAFREAAHYGGDVTKVFVTGHSAGGYLTAMIGLDRSWLQAYGVEADSIRGLVPFSPQVISHFAYRHMNGLGYTQPTIDRFAPLYHLRPDCPPLILITGDRELELLGRYEECAYLWRMMQIIRHPQTRIYELDGFSHNTMFIPAFHILRQWIRTLTGEEPQF